MILVFDGEIADEPLSLRFFQDAGHVRDAASVRHVMGGQAHLIQILQVAGDDMAFQDAQALDRFQAGADPMPGIRTDTDARVAVFDQGEDVIGVPHTVAGVVRPPRMVAERDHHPFNLPVVGVMPHRDWGVSYRSSRAMRSASSAEYWP